MIRLLIVDDHEMVRAGLRTLLARIPDLEIVGEASGAEEAVNTAVELQPDVMLMVTSITKAYHFDFWLRPRKSSRLSASKPARDSSRIMRGAFANTAP